MAHMGGSASADIDASVEQVWEEVQDVLSSPDWQEGLESMNALEHDELGRPTLVDSENDAKVRRIKTRLRFSYDPPTRLSWTQDRGDLKSLEGSWTLEDLGAERTRATYMLDGDPGRVLGMLLRGPVEDRVRALLVDKRPSELKARVEGG